MSSLFMGAIGFAAFGNVAFDDFYVRMLFCACAAGLWGALEAFVFGASNAK